MKSFSFGQKPIRRIRFSTTCALLGVYALGTVFTSVDVLAQESEISGTAWVSHWPDTRGLNSRRAGPPIDYTDYNLLPFIDTLAVHYQFSTDPSNEDLVSMHFAVEWTEGPGGILAGRPVDWTQMPEGVVIESIDVLMQVVVGEDAVAEFMLPLDSIALGPVPSVTFVYIVDVDWNSVFLDTREADAREIFRSGFQLSSPRIIRALFAVEHDSGDPMAANESRVPADEPRYRTEFIPDVDIWISWVDGRDRYFPPPRLVRKGSNDQRGEIGRNALTGRRSRDRGGADDGADEVASRTGVARDSRAPSRGSRTSGRSGGGFWDSLTGSGKSKDDDDDDEDRLLPAAIAGVAMVGGLAFLGGTVGYFGSGSKAPIGIMSGYVQPNWGVILHVSMNAQVFGKKSGPENLIAGITGFNNFFNSRLQPSIGIGARFTEEGTTSTAVEPSFALGLVGNLGPVVLLAGYDLTTPDFRFGIGVNFRHEE